MDRISSPDSDITIEMTPEIIDAMAIPARSSVATCVLGPILASR